MRDWTRQASKAENNKAKKIDLQEVRTAFVRKFKTQHPHLCARECLKQASAAWSASEERKVALDNSGYSVAELKRRRFI